MTDAKPSEPAVDSAADPSAGAPVNPGADPRVGSVLQDRYKVLDVVAAGGMAVVYRGERLQLGRPVAIKFLKPWVASQRSFLQRFEVEARAMSRLSHPNCASVIDFGVADVPYLIMDFVAGRSLRHLLESERLEPARALGLARQILAGVAHAHAQGIVHRDLKPENIVVSDTPGLIDHVRVLDFGLAKLHDGPALTVGMAVGTPSYMAPEQTQSEGAIDARTDLYAVGVMLFEMLTGRKPFVSDDVAQMILMHQRQRAPRMSATAGGASFSEALEAAVAKALAKAPADRFASAEAMAAALEQVPENSALRPAAGLPPEAAKLQELALESDGAGSAAVGATLTERNFAEKTLVDATIAAPARPAQVVPPKTRPSPQAEALAWKRWLGPCWKPWGYRHWLWTGATVVALLAVVLLATLHSHRSQPFRLPPPPPAATVAPSVPTADELSPMGPDSTPGLADAAQLVRLGLREQAITVLQDIRRDYPRSAYVNFLLAVSYFEKLWWSIGLQHAQAAIQLDPAYRRSPKLARLLIRSLVSDAFWEKAADFLVQDLAESAPPYLEEAAQLDKSAKVRARAAQILASPALRGRR